MVANLGSIFRTGWGSMIDDYILLLLAVSVTLLAIAAFIIVVTEFRRK
jgi:hypothetical protein